MKESKYFHIKFTKVTNKSIHYYRKIKSVYTGR